MKWNTLLIIWYCCVGGCPNITMLSYRIFCVPILKIRWFHDHVILITEIPITRNRVFILRWGSGVYMLYAISELLAHVILLLRYNQTQLVKESGCLPFHLSFISHKSFKWCLLNFTNVFFIPNLCICLQKIMSTATNEYFLFNFK